MTVCIAALSTYLDTEGVQRSAIILASDRMITARRIREYKLADQTKVTWFRDNTAVLMSGSVDSLYEAYMNAWKRVEKDCTVQELAKVVAVEVQAIRRRDVERRYLHPCGLDVDSLISRQKEWTPDFFERLSILIGDDDNDLGSIIIAGFDTLEGQEYAQLYTIEGPGWERNWTGTGFCAIGIGAGHAEAEFAHAMYSPKRNWFSAMRIALFAKKRAEEAPGVGGTTDLWHVIAGGRMQYEPTSRVTQELTTMFNTMRTLELQSITTDAARLSKILAEEGSSVARPRAATEEERKEAEAKADEADAGVNASDLRSSSQESESPG